MLAWQSEELGSKSAAGTEFVKTYKICLVIGLNYIFLKYNRIIKPIEHNIM